MNKKLLLVKDNTQYLLKETMEVGRGDQRDIHIPLAAVSDLHATITCLDNMYTIRDNDSTNGTYINHRKLNPQIEYPLKEGYVLRFGSETFHVVAATQESAQLNIDPRFAVLQEIKKGEYIWFYGKIKEDNSSILIKALNQKLAEDDTINIFHRECRLMRKLKGFVHPNIVRIHHIEMPSSAANVYLVMEALEGANITKCVEGNFISESFAVDIALQIAKATAILYDKFQIIHRDICPDNILLTSKLVPKISNLSSSKGETSITLTIEMGENNADLYMAPEIILEEKSHCAQSDIYSLGLTLYFMVKKKLPFHSVEEVVSFANSGVPAPQLEDTAIDRVLSKMIAHDYNKRFASYDELIESLEKLKEILGIDKIEQTEPLDRENESFQEQNFDKGKTIQTKRLGDITKSFLKQMEDKKKT